MFWVKISVFFLANCVGRNMTLIHHFPSMVGGIRRKIEIKFDFIISNSLYSRPTSRVLDGWMMDGLMDGWMDG